MPLPRRSLTGNRKKKKPTASRSGRNELLMFIAGPAMPDYIIKSVADDLFGSVLYHRGRTLQIVDTRIDGRKIYGKI